MSTCTLKIDNEYQRTNTTGRYLVVNQSTYPFTLFHGQIVPSQIIPQNSKIVPQYSENLES